MKRMWIGAALLALVLVSGIWIGSRTERIYVPMAQDMDRAARQAMEEDWDMAMALTTRARGQWEEKRPVTACFVEHEPLDAIDGLFAQLEVYAAARNSGAYSAGCVYLARQLEALGRCHSFSFINLL